VTAALRARGASLRYRRRETLALDAIDLEVSPGELVTLLGPNGSGKSSLLRLLAGLETPTSGAVTLEGKAASSYARDEAARLAAFVPQTASVTFDVTGLEVALQGRHPFGRGLFLDSADDIARAEEALALAGAGAFRDRPFRSLSGGERQRVLLARAIAQGSPALLLDEPSSAQDLAHALFVFELARKLARERSRAVVIATHDVNAAARFSDRVAVLCEGRLVKTGPPRVVLTEETLRSVFGVEALVGTTPGGAPYFVALEPRRERPLPGPPPRAGAGATGP
jgi:iron complex transport system ATP-binding protein